MKTFNQLPVPELRPFIDRLWGWESLPAEIVHLPKLLPGTGAEMYFHYGATFQLERVGSRLAELDRGHLFCIRRCPITLQPVSGLGFVAVRFRVGMLHRFTDIPVGELEDCQLSVGDIWGKAGERLSHQLVDAANNSKRIALVQNFLASQLRSESSDLLVETAMNVLYRRSNTQSIEALSRDFNIGRRQLERRWKKFAGHTPIEIKGLIRFQKTIRGLMLDPSANTADIATECGYFDQAHFIHDFQLRVGQTPQVYLSAARTKTHFYNTCLNNTGILAAPNM